MADDTIYRQAAINFKVSHGINECGVLYVPYGEVKKYLEQLPSAQPKREKGKWYAIGNTCLATCECGYITDRYSVYNYCPKCGALMKGEDDE